MAKKTKTVPKYIQNMFNKPQYKVGDAVCITWLGTKKYGFIIKIKKSNEEIAYSVRANDTTYPCGIQIKEYISKYRPGGLVQHDSAESQKTISRKASTSNTRVVEDSDGNSIRTATKNTVSRTNVFAVDSKTSAKSTRTRTSSRKTNEQSNSTSTRKTRTRKSAACNGSELNEAIQRQKDFLKGFTKK